MQNKRVAAAASKLGLRLVVTEQKELTDDEIAGQFADLLERKYDLANRGSIGGLRFSNLVEVDEFPENPAHVARAMEILGERGYDTEPTDYSDKTRLHMTVRMSPRDPHG